MVVSPKEAEEWDDAAPYVLIRNGYFYRPLARGYTASLAEAGRFTPEEAARHSEAEGTTARLVSMCEEVAPVCTWGMLSTPGARGQG